MNNMIQFAIFQKPTGKATVHHTKSGIAYHTKEQKMNEQALMTEMLPFRPKEPISDPVYLYIRAYFSVPISKPKWWRKAALSGDIRHDKKPDCDNIIKQIGDCLKKLQFFKDDNQIYRCECYKGYSKNPRIEISIEPVSNIIKQEWVKIDSTRAILKSQ